MALTSTFGLRLPALVPGLDPRATTARLILNLTRQAVSASTLAEGVQPTLDFLVNHTAAVGSAYVEFTAASILTYHIRATWGPARHFSIEAPLPDPALMQAIEASSEPLFFDTFAPMQSPALDGIEVASLAVAPVRAKNGALVGAFIIFTFEPHIWQPAEAVTFSLVSSTVAALSVRLAADEAASDAREAALRAMGLALEARDGETKGHTDRVTALAMRMAQVLGWGPCQTQGLRWGAYLHDIGKIAIPDAVLLKPGALTDAEWAVMRLHVEEGVRFAGALGFLPETALAVIADHHERWNGQGYPAGKAGEDISLAGRVFALCDVYDALTSERPYKAAWTPRAALAEITAQAGQHFDPELARLFVQLLTEEQHLLA